MTARPCRWIRETQPVVSAPTSAPAPGAAYRNPSVDAPPPNTEAASAGNSARGMPNTMALMSIRYAPWMACRPRKKRRPSTIERRPGRRAPAPGGCGDIRDTASSATPNPATSSQYTKRTPAPASSSPASAGPATRPNWNSDWKMAFAVDTSDLRTRFGTMALRPALSSALNPAARAGSTNSGHSAVPRSTLIASPALHAAISTCAIISRRRRSIASTTEPPSSDPVISGNSWVMDTSPTSSDEWVS